MHIDRGGARLDELMLWGIAWKKKDRREGWEGGRGVRGGVGDAVEAQTPYLAASWYRTCAIRWRRGPKGIIVLEKQPGEQGQGWGGGLGCIQDAMEPLASAW